MKSQFGKMFKLVFEEEYDRESLNLEKIKKLYNYSRYQDNMYFGEPSTGLNPTPAEISISLKFESILKQIVENESRLGHIAEDDAIIVRKDFDWESFESNFPSDGDVIFWGSALNMRLPKNFILRKISNILGKSLHKKDHPATRHLDGFTITVEAAKRVLELYEGPVMAVDHYFNYIFADLDLNVYWLDPPITTQGSKNGTYKSCIRKE